MPAWNPAWPASVSVTDRVPLATKLPEASTLLSRSPSPSFQTTRSQQHVAAADDRDGGRRAISRLDGEGLSQRVAIAQRLNRRVVVGSGVSPRRQRSEPGRRRRRGWCRLGIQLGRHRVSVTDRVPLATRLPAPLTPASSVTEPVVPDEEMTAESFDPLMVMVTVADVPSAALTVKVSVSVSPLPSA